MVHAEIVERQRASEKKVCKGDKACLEEADRHAEKLYADYIDFGNEVGWWPTRDDPKPGEDAEGIYWPCGREQPFHEPGHPEKPMTFDSCAHGACDVLEEEKGIAIGQS